MGVTVIGCGYLGAVHAVCLADAGHEVVGIDVDERKIEALSAGRAPFHKPELPDVLRRAIDSGRLRFSHDIAEATRHRRPAGAGEPVVHFICVSTPQRQGEFAADTTYVDAALDSLVPHLAPGDLVVGKSTVPVGTAGRLAEIVARRAPGAVLAWNPEFLREGHAVADTRRPDRIVYGLPPGQEDAA